MISISAVSASQARNYYYQRDPLFPENSFWLGKTAKRFGLEPGLPVGKAEFMALLTGLDPNTGEQLVADGPNGKRHGYDLTLSAPKSYSLLALTSGDERLIQIFTEAVQRTGEYAEEHFIQVRRSIEGEKVRENSHGLAMGVFFHSTSRSLDANLHAHGVLANISWRDDGHDTGKYVAIENRLLFENRHLLDQIFKGELAAGVQELGYSVIRTEKGDFEISGVAPETIQAFSKRRAQVLEKAEELKESGTVNGLHDAAIREQANLQSRDSKTYVEESALREKWDRELAELGTTREKMLEQAREAGRLAGHDRASVMTAEDYVRIATASLNETESTFGKGDILKTAGKLSVGEYRIADLESAFTSLVDEKELIQLDGKDKGFSGTYTTKEMKRIEKQLVSMIRNSVGRYEPLMSPDKAEEAIDAYIAHKQESNPDFGLTRGQRLAVSKILTADGHILIQGDGGTGKSVSMSVLAHALSVYAEKPVDLHGLCFTGKGAAELAKSSSIPSLTLASFLSEREDGSDRQPGSISKHERMYIVDESSMLSSRDAYQLFRRAEREGSKVVMVGDVKQLLGVNAGKIFSDLQQYNIIDVTQMTEVLRQKTEAMKDLVADVSAKRVDAAFQKLQSHGRLHQIEDRSELIQAITQNYADRENWRETLVVTNTNQSRNELNQSLRQELQTQDKISRENIPLTVRTAKNLTAVEKYFGTSYQVGDYVFASKAGGGLRAGSESEVIGVDREKHVLTLEDTEGNIRFYDLKTHGDKLSAFSETVRPFSQHEKILFTKNDKFLGVQNGSTGTIQQIDRDGNLNISMETGGAVSFNVRNFAYLDYSACTNLHKSQGMTADSIIYHVDSGNDRANTLNAFYTGVTRAKFDATVFTDDIAGIREQMKNEAVKTSTLDFDKTLAELDRRGAMEVDKEKTADERSELMPERNLSVNDREHDIKDRVAERESGAMDSLPARETDTGISRDYELSR